MADSDERDGLLLLETINPLDMTEEDLAELAEEITAVVGVHVGIAYEDQTGAGVSWHEMLHLWLPSIDFLKDEGWEIILGIVVENLRRRFRRSGNERRPKTLTVRDPDTGRVVMELTIEEAESEPEKKEPDQAPRRRPPLKRKIG
jgi:hypothetical protein